MPGENILDWSTTASNNGTADSSINWAEGMARAAVNDSARSMMAAHAKDRDLKNGSITTGGSANAQTITSGMSFTANPTGMMVRVKNGFTNTASMTLQLDSAIALTVKNIFGNNIAPGSVFVNAYSEYICDGTNWILLQDRQGKYLLDVQTAASSAALNFITAINSSFEEYIFEIAYLQPATDGVDLWCLVSTDGGSTYKTGATDYRWANFITADNATNSSTGSTADTKIKLVTAISNSSSQGVNGTVNLFKPSSAAVVKHFKHDLEYVASTPVLIRAMGSAFYNAITAVNAVQFLMSSGNIADGVIRMYGLQK